MKLTPSWLLTDIITHNLMLLLPTLNPVTSLVHMFHHFSCSFTQVLQMYLPFCGISISNAKLFSESRKEYERSRVRSCEVLHPIQAHLPFFLWGPWGFGCDSCCRRPCWRWSMTCLKSRPTWRRLWGRSCSERWRCCSVNAAPCSYWRTLTHLWDACLTNFLNFSCLA